MSTAFLSGSRTIRRLGRVIQDRIQDMIDRDFRIVVGDANGADRAMQSYLTEQGYRNVVVFCVGDKCRNNIGSWPTESVRVDSSLRGRAPYTQRDAAMAAHADFGLVLWDGKSEGSLNNVFELLKQNKKAEVFFMPREEFMDIGTPDDAETLLQSCGTKILRALEDSRHLRRQMRSLSIGNQKNLKLAPAS